MLIAAAAALAHGADLDTAAVVVTSVPNHTDTSGAMLRTPEQMADAGAVLSVQAADASATHELATSRDGPPIVMSALPEATMTVPSPDESVKATSAVSNATAVLADAMPVPLDDAKMADATTQQLQLHAPQQEEAQQQPPPQPQPQQPQQQPPEPRPQPVQQQQQPQPEQRQPEQHQRRPGKRDEEEAEPRGKPRAAPPTQHAVSTRARRAPGRPAAIESSLEDKRRHAAPRMDGPTRSLTRTLSLALALTLTLTQARRATHGWAGRGGARGRTAGLAAHARVG